MNARKILIFAVLGVALGIPLSMFLQDSWKLDGVSVFEYIERALLHLGNEPGKWKLRDGLLTGMALGGLGGIVTGVFVEKFNSSDDSGTEE